MISLSVCCCWHKKLPNLAIDLGVRVSGKCNQNVGNRKKKGLLFASKHLTWFTSATNHAFLLATPIERTHYILMPSAGITAHAHSEKLAISQLYHTGYVLYELWLDDVINVKKWMTTIIPKWVIMYIPR